jgi:hypothetical protein
LSRRRQAKTEIERKEKIHKIKKLKEKIPTSPSFVVLVIATQDRLFDSRTSAAVADKYVRRRLPYIHVYERGATLCSLI